MGDCWLRSSPAGTRCRCTGQDYATEAEEWADLIADNRLAELAEKDDAALLQMLKELEASQALPLTGYSDQDLLALLAQVNASQDRPEDFDAEEAMADPDAAGIATRVQPGEVWQLGRHRLLCGDATDPVSWQRLMAGKVAQAVVTDPPYGINYVGGRAAQAERIGAARRGIEAPSDAYWDDLTAEQYRGLLVKSLVLAHRFSDEEAPLYLWFASTHLRDVLACLEETGWQERNLLVWVKNNGAGALFAQYKHWYEPCFYAHKRGQAPRWHGPTNERTVWEHDKPLANELHPTMKPLPLIERSINNATEPGHLVIDPFLGSGTAIVAAERTGRICCGMDLEPRYCDVIIARWEAETGESAVRPDSGGRDGEVR
jgi:DNA modification methylase